MNTQTSKNQFLEDEILMLKEKRKAIILAHYYQDEDIQDIADFVGDSLDLSKKAANTDCMKKAFNSDVHTRIRKNILANKKDSGCERC